MAAEAEGSGIPESHTRPILRYFDEIIPVERKAIDERRADIKKRRADFDRGSIGKPRPLPGETPKDTGERPDLLKFPYPGDDPKGPNDVRLGGDDPPDGERLRPRPEPRDLTGLSLSGGGVRSAAVCLGALQALEVHKAIDGIDYLSTVSGGGYIGASLTVGMSVRSRSGDPSPTFPFQRANDPRDTPAVGHIRNYSNYLLPRATSGVRNVSEAAVIILRGILANAVLVAATLLGFALLTNIVYPTRASLDCGSFFARMLGLTECSLLPRFWLTLLALLALLFILLAWVLSRSARAGRSGRVDDDVNSPMLRLATLVFWFLLICGFFDVQPTVIAGLDKFYVSLHEAPAPISPQAILAAAATLVSAVAGFSGKIGQFLQVSEHASSWKLLLGRAASRVLIWLAALLLPLLLYIVYLHLAAWGTAGLDHVPHASGIANTYVTAFIATLVVGFFFKPNSYSLHQLYRDRLSKAFLFDPQDPEKRPADSFKLSDIDARRTPYHLINAAMNVQGSLAANQRGREADFFTFTRDFVGSDLTLYASTDEKKPSYGHIEDMEDADPALDVATAMAISGAAFSANMGSSTIRPLSPTLALLNVRLGYWLRNPRDLAKRRSANTAFILAHRFLSKFYLLLEMLNLLEEKSRNIYLSDGGHIENLGVYELLKRGCQLVIAVDAECDPTLSFGSLIKMERFARIDLGIRIDLPWEEITDASRRYDRALTAGILSCPSSNGPHCVIGHILYHDGSEGVLFYVKSSVTGDETDYVLDYKRRYPQFPHETTGDQFFSEDQFEAYRALGFHIVDRALGESDQVAMAQSLTARGITQPMMIAWIKQVLCCR
jgi:patatin-like phospholipase